MAAPKEMDDTWADRTFKISEVDDLNNLKDRSTRSVYELKKVEHKQMLNVRLSFHKFKIKKRRKPHI